MKPIEPLEFRYSSEIQLTKDFCKLLIFLMPLILVLMISKNQPEDYSSYSTYLYAFALPVFMMVVVTLYAGSWSNIRIVEDGIRVEFLWTELPVKWDEIKMIRRYGSHKFGGWIVITKNRLTVFHRLYSLVTILSLDPGFQIHSVENTMGHAVSIMKKRAEV